MRRIEKNDEGIFFNWNIDMETGIQRTKGTNSLAARACTACTKLDIQMKEKEELNHKVLELSKEDKTVEIKAANSANNTLLSLVREKWKKVLNQNTFHFHSFQRLQLLHLAKITC